MRKLFFVLGYVLLTAHQSKGQNVFPQLDSNSIVSKQTDISNLNKPYTVIIYGGIGCRYSQFLIQNLDKLDECKQKTDIILIMVEPKDSIIKYMEKTIEIYPTFTNTRLQYKLKKKSDRIPQVLVFKNQVQIHHVVGVKEAMLTKIKALIVNDK